jgi:hypothetical protein
MLMPPNERNIAMLDDKLLTFDGGMKHSGDPHI